MSLPFLGNRLFSGSAGPVDKSSSLLLTHLQSTFHHLSRLLASILTPLTSSPLSSDDPVISELSGFYVTASNCHAVSQCQHLPHLPISVFSICHSPISILLFPFPNSNTSDISGCHLVCAKRTSTCCHR